MTAVGTTSSQEWGLIFPFVFVAILYMYTTGCGRGHSHLCVCGPASGGQSRAGTGRTPRSDYRPPSSSVIYTCTVDVSREP